MEGGGEMTTTAVGGKRRKKKVEAFVRRMVNQKAASGLRRLQPAQLGTQCHPREGKGKRKRRMGRHYQVRLLDEQPGQREGVGEVR